MHGMMRWTSSATPAGTVNRWKKITKKKRKKNPEHQRWAKARRDFRGRCRRPLHPWVVEAGEAELAPPNRQPKRKRLHGRLRRKSRRARRKLLLAKNRVPKSHAAPRRAAAAGNLRARRPEARREKAT